MQQCRNTTRWVVVIGITLLGAFLSASAQAAAFTVNSSFDVSDANPGNGVCETAPGNGVCTLRAAIQEANHTASGGATIILPALLPGGFYTLQIPTSGSDDETTGDLNITNSMDIIGAGAASTIIDGNRSVTNARVFRIGSGVSVRISGVTVRNGQPHGNGGGILNLGRLTLTNSAVSENEAASNDGAGIYNLGTLTLMNSTVSANFGFISSGGGIYNDQGTLALTNSTVSGNTAVDAFGGGGIYNDQGTVTLTNSTVSGNLGFNSAGGGILNDRGTLTLTNSTVSSNGAFKLEGGGILNNRGTLTLTNSTVSGNNAWFSGGGIYAANGGTVHLENTILALNTLTLGSDNTNDCAGVGALTSLGNNLIGDPTGCTINLQPTDLSGDPGLGEFIDDGAPGHGRLPLLSRSQAISAGNAATCPPTDQLGTPRNGPCDIGAVEFYPVVNDLVSLANLTTAFDPSPVQGGPAGIFRITAEFTNTSNQAIVNSFVEVVELTGGNLLLNADGGAGGVGARVTFSKSESTAFLPGATETFEFVIGLQKQEPFTFFVSLLGDLQTSNSVVGLLRDARASNP